MLDGDRRMVTSQDGTEIALLSAGAGRPLLLVHGGMTSSSRWQPLWPLLTTRFRVTAMDRRGRGNSGDGNDYSLANEFDDVTAAAADLAEQAGEPVDVFGHSYGALCALGAAAAGAPFRRLVLYEPPGPETVQQSWLNQASAWITAGQPSRAMASFLIDVIGLSPHPVASMRNTSVANESVDIVAATMQREAAALTVADLDNLARRVRQSVMLLLGSDSPPWASTITTRLANTLTTSTVTHLDGAGHEAVDTAPETVTTQLRRFLLDTPGA